MNCTLLKAGIFNLSPVRFNALSAELISILFQETASDTAVKFSRAISPRKARSSSFIEECLREVQCKDAISCRHITHSKLDCNIQQLKCNEFTTLYYGIFFDDVIEIYKTSNSKVYSIPGYCNVQHKGNFGEGQFHITPKTIDWHRENNLCKSITYKELYSLLGGGDNT